jgi:hypothetical protein
MSRETAIVFNDGSLESKVLQFELKTSYDLEVVNVDKYEDLQKWIEKAIEYTEGAFKGIIKIILHFPFEDYVTKDIRTQMMEIQRKNPNLRIIAWYEQAPRDGLKNRAANYGIVAEPTKIETEPFKGKTVEPVKWEKDKVLEHEYTWRPLDTEIGDKTGWKDPDDEMKAEVLDMSPKAVEEFTKDWKEIKLPEPTQDVKDIASDIVKESKKKRKKKWNI